MKQTILLSTLITGAVLGLSACGGGGSNTPTTGFTEFNGTWTGTCEELTARQRSYKQEWDISGASLDNDISVWIVPNCAGGSFITAQGKANVEYQGEEAVANTCATGKAQKVKVTYTSLIVGNQTFSNEQDINGFLNPQGITLPKYNLICKDGDGKLRSGLFTATNDGSTELKRPTEMDTVKSFSP